MFSRWASLPGKLSHIPGFDRAAGLWNDLGGCDVFNAFGWDKTKAAIRQRES
jgi:hypothetical protein